MLAGQASHPCRANFLKRGGQVRAFVLSGAHAKDGLYLLWACGHEPIGLANGPIRLDKPYFIFYPLHTYNVGVDEIITYYIGSSFNKCQLFFAALWVEH